VLLDWNIQRIWKRLHYSIFNIKLKEDAGLQQPPHHIPRDEGVIEVPFMFSALQLTYLAGRDMYVSCIVTSIPLLTKVHTLSCNDGVTQI
jgi:hypothetical protein